MATPNKPPATSSDIASVMANPMVRFLAAFAYHALLGLGTRGNQRSVLGAASSHAGVDAPSNNEILRWAQAANDHAPPKAANDNAAT